MEDMLSSHTGARTPGIVIKCARKILSNVRSTFGPDILFCSFMTHGLETRQESE